MERVWTSEEIADFPGEVQIFRPHMEHQKSSYSRVVDVKEFCRQLNAKGSPWVPVCRVEKEWDRRVLRCVLTLRKREIPESS